MQRGAAFVLPVLLICLGTLLPNVEQQTKDALKWTGVGLLILQCIITLCICALPSLRVMAAEEDDVALLPKGEGAPKHTSPLYSFKAAQSH